MSWEVDDGTQGVIAQGGKPHCFFYYTAMAGSLAAIRRLLPPAPDEAIERFSFAQRPLSSLPRRVRW